ncbi:Uncharacterised protein [Klebsiella pneumoniae]|uniref:Uncharacterized protein n=1 Tax=Klebsiella pneumoniae TaxID=573 RepID=A0A378BGQ5_KLEPN|nr:Uncharacterised protein [Klebsiella pneumoniae]
MPSVRNEPDEMVAAWSAGLWEKSASAATSRAVQGVSSSMVVLAHFDITRWVSTSGISRSACSNATPSGAPVAPVIPIISFIPDLITFVRVRTLYLNYPLQPLLARSFVYVRIFNQNAERV